MSSLLAWETFWMFVRERHRIYQRRQAGEPRPWTEEPILRDYFFTNVYRELDPGTIFIREQLQKHPMAELQTKLFNVMLYRYALNERGFTDWGWHVPWNFSAYKFVRWAVKFDRPFHNAYNISNQGSTMPKHEVVAETAASWADFLQTYWGGWPSREVFIEWLRQARAMGPFLATQVLADLTYDQHVQLPEDGYVELGGGALRGLTYVLEGTQHQGKVLPAKRAHEVLEALWQGQDPEHRDVLPKHLTKMNLQNCACEFSKWVRGGGRRRYHGPGYAPAQQGELL